MNIDEYKRLVNKLTPKENKLKNFFIAFLIGGLIGLFSEVLINVLTTAFGISETESFIWCGIIIILLGSLFTSLGFFDNWVSYAKAGLIVPTTGFAHSITSSALDYKKDGLITGLGANFFKLAGSVILYGILSSVVLLLVRMILCLV